MEKTIRVTITDKTVLDYGDYNEYYSKDGNMFINFSMLQRILCENKDIFFSLYIDGGEPFLHKELFLFLEYADCFHRCEKIFIKTTGILVNDYCESIKDIALRWKKPIELHVQVTSESIKEFPDHISRCKELIHSFESDTDIKVSLKVLFVNEEDKNSLLNMIVEAGIPENNYELLCVTSYGKLEEACYPLPEEDGKTVYYTLNGEHFLSISDRAKYEHDLFSGKVPVFDSVNHMLLWSMSKSFLVDVSFENKDLFDEDSFLNFQKEYIKSNINKFTEGMVENGIYSYAEFYSSKFNDEHDHSPFVKYSMETYRNLESESMFLYKTFITTIDIKRFYQYKNTLINLCHYIAQLGIDDSVKTTESGHCGL